jgi:hypothetical protein
VYHALGVPPETLPDPANPTSKVSTGQPVLDIFV